MKKNKDIVLDERVNKSSFHKSRISINGPNTLFPSNPIRGDHKIGDFVLAKVSDKDFKSGTLLHSYYESSELVFKVRLHEIHNSEIIITKIIK